MKKKALLSVLLLFLMTIPSFSRNIHFGLGIALEYDRDIAYSRFSSIRLQKFYLPLTIGSSVRIIPEFGYWNGKYKFSTYNEEKFYVFHAGVGLYYLKSLDKTNLYFGPRWAQQRMKSPHSPNAFMISKKTDHTYGLTLGAEYRLASNFSIGFEVQYNYYEIKPWENPDYYGNRIRRALESVFVIAFHI